MPNELRSLGELNVCPLMIQRDLQCKLRPTSELKKSKRFNMGIADWGGLIFMPKWNPCLRGIIRLNRTRKQLRNVSECIAIRTECCEMPPIFNNHGRLIGIDCTCIPKAGLRPPGTTTAECAEFAQCPPLRRLKEDLHARKRKRGAILPHHSQPSDLY